MAYGARLESVLGESPRGFESPILRHVAPLPWPQGGLFLESQHSFASAERMPRHILRKENR